MPSHYSWPGTIQDAGAIAVNRKRISLIHENITCYQGRGAFKYKQINSKTRAKEEITVLNSHNVEGRECLIKASQEDDLQTNHQPLYFLGEGHFRQRGQQVQRQEHKKRFGQFYKGSERRLVSLECV